MCGGMSALRFREVSAELDTIFPLLGVVPLGIRMDRLLMGSHHPCHLKKLRQSGRVRFRTLSL